MLLALALVACERPPFATAEARRAIDFHTHLAPGSAPVAQHIFAAAGLTAVVHLDAQPYGPDWEASRAEHGAGPVPVIPFCGIDWRLLYPDYNPEPANFGALAAEQLRRAAAAGCRGIKVSKALGLRLRKNHDELLRIDDPLLDPIFAAAGELRLPVAIHTGDPLAFFLPFGPDNERYDELLAHPSWRFSEQAVPSLIELLAARDRLVGRHPGTTFVAVHVGGFPENLPAVAASLSAHPNLWIDVAARLPEIGRRPAAMVRDFVHRFADRILLGTDLQIDRQGIVLGAGDSAHDAADALAYYRLHWTFFETDTRKLQHLTPIQGRWSIDAIGLGRADLEAVYGGNARRLLRLP